MTTIYESDDLAAIRVEIRRFVEDQVLSRGEAWEAAGEVPRQVLLDMGAIGFFGLRVPEEYGGVGMGHLASVVMAEEFGRSTFGGFSITSLVHTDLAMPYVVNFGSDEQKRAWLPSMLTGETLTAIGVTEPDAGSDVAAIRTTARRDGDGHRLNGTKLYITNGGIADMVFIAARTDLEVKASRGISIFAVEKGTPGFEASRALSKMGWKSSNTAELVLDDCWVPDSHIVGELDRGFYSIMHNFQNERLVIMAMAVGEAAKAIELTVEWVRNRKAFGSSLWSKQAIRQRLAMHAAEVEAARLLVYDAAWRADRGEDVVKQVSMCKALAGELVNAVLYDCVQFHGGMGYLTESPIERMYRDARIHSIGGGATEVMLDEIAKRM
ncbi:MAG TPA: acyl-CoA dehydrogenase family protein [Acidimicrobiia bacterium]